MDRFLCVRGMQLTLTSQRSQEDEVSFGCMREREREASSGVCVYVSAMHARERRNISDIASLALSTRRRFQP